MKRVALASVLTAVISGYAEAGLQWTQTMTSSDTQGNVDTVVMTCYAQAGNLRQEFTEVKRKKRREGMEKGFWLFRGDANMVTMVDETEKTYVEVSLDDMMAMTGGMSSLMHMKISNASVKVEQLASEKFGGFQCARYRVLTTYDLEMNMMMVNIKQRVEQVAHHWMTAAVPTQEISLAFINKQYRTGMKDLDALIQKNIEAYRDLMKGFPIKTIVTATTIDLAKKNAKPQTTWTETVVSDIKTRALSASLFKIPEGYKKVEMFDPEAHGSNAKDENEIPVQRTQKPASSVQKNTAAKDETKRAADKNTTSPTDTDDSDAATREAIKKGLQNLFFK